MSRRYESVCDTIHKRHVSLPGRVNEAVRNTHGNNERRDNNDVNEEGEDRVDREMNFKCK